MLYPTFFSDNPSRGKVHQRERVIVIWWLSQPALEVWFILSFDAPGFGCHLKNKLRMSWVFGKTKSFILKKRNFLPPAKPPTDLACF